MDPGGRVWRRAEQACERVVRLWWRRVSAEVGGGEGDGEGGNDAGTVAWMWEMSW